MLLVSIIALRGTREPDETSYRIFACDVLISVEASVAPFTVQVFLTCACIVYRASDSCSSSFISFILLVCLSYFSYLRLFFISAVTPLQPVRARYTKRTLDYNLIPRKRVRFTPGTSRGQDG